MATTKTRTRSVARVARRESAKDVRERTKISKLINGTGSSTMDSFVNFSQQLGVGADNALSSSTYGFNPITRIRTLLEWIHRGSWIGGMVVDVVADDMTRAGIDIICEADPGDIKKIQKKMVSMGIWRSIRSGTAWGRLFGGGLCVMLVEGQDPKTPFRPETVGRNQFRGLLDLDRWMVEVSLNDLVTELGPHLGKPKYYRVMGDAPALVGQVFHHSRIIRFEGVEVPHRQKLMEQLWGISVLERLYDRMIAFDSATTGAAQLVYKSFIRTYKIKDLRDIVATGGAPYEGLIKYVEMMRRFQGIEGITLLDGEDEMEAMQHAAFSGLSDAMLQFGQQLSGACGIPLVRLFGQSPAGLNATGESDFRMYYDGIKQKQVNELEVDLTRVVQALGRSEGVPLPPEATIEFVSLWQLDAEQKANIANTVTDAVSKAEEAGLITQQAAMKELKQSSEVTGIFTNITDEEIESANAELTPPEPEPGVGEPGEPGEELVSGEEVPAESKQP